MGLLAADTGVDKSLSRSLKELLPKASAKAAELIHDLRAIASQAGTFADNMDFKFLFNPDRKLLSVAFDANKNKSEPACYDQLASESRVATFVAIAKNDIPQESWFALARRHAVNNERIVLLSWSGTMFEYLMPSLWMETHPDTLLDRATLEAVRAQRAYGDRRNIPWGISESGYAEKDDGGGYKYFAFGLPGLALRSSNAQLLVVSPYSTLLALHVDSDEALKNLRRMERAGWLGALGFYEAVDFGEDEKGRRRRQPEIVRCWMAHHQGMSLLAIANFLGDGVARRWFHKNPYVQATELLLQEKPVTRANPQLGRPRFAA